LSGGSRGRAFVGVGWGGGAAPRRTAAAARARGLPGADAVHVVQVVPELEKGARQQPAAREAVARPLERRRRGPACVRHRVGAEARPRRRAVLPRDGGRDALERQDHQRAGVVDAPFLPGATGGARDVAPEQEREVEAPGERPRERGQLGEQGVGRDGGNCEIGDAAAEGVRQEDDARGYGVGVAGCGFGKEGRGGGGVRESGSGRGRKKKEKKTAAAATMNDV